MCLFAMLCGYLPFEEADTSALYRKIMAGQYSCADFISSEAKVSERGGSGRVWGGMGGREEGGEGREEMRHRGSEGVGDSKEAGRERGGLRRGASIHMVLELFSLCFLISLQQSTLPPSPSPPSQTLIHGMLTTDPAHRFGVAEIYSNTWFIRRCASPMVPALSMKPSLLPHLERIDISEELLDQAKREGGDGGEHEVTWDGQGGGRTMQGEQ